LTTDQEVKGLNPFGVTNKNKTPDAKADRGFLFSHKRQKPKLLLAKWKNKKQWIRRRHRFCFLTEWKKGALIHYRKACATAIALAHAVSFCKRKREIKNCFAIAKWFCFSTEYKKGALIHYRKACATAKALAHR